MSGWSRSRSTRLLATGLTVALAVIVVAWVVSDGSGTADDSVAADHQPGTVSFRDDFERDEIGDMWSPYTGQPGGDPYSLWDPSQVTVEDGNLVLRADRRADGGWLTGGVSNWQVTQTYGRWELRFRADAADDVTFHFLLWPERDAWPPEIDFLENFGGDRRVGSAFVHWVDENGDRQKVEKTLNDAGIDVDFTEWTTVGVDWRPGRVDFLIDGEVWDSVEGDMVPDEPMWLALQAQSGACARAAEFGYSPCPHVGTPEGTRVEIDWVEIHAYD